MKTKQGTYYYISVGPNYYAGTKPIMTKVYRTVVDKDALKSLREKIPKYQLGKNGLNGYRRSHYLIKGQTQLREKNPRNGIYGGVPQDTESLLVPTDKFVEDWTTDFTKAKKFRIKTKALAKAEELAKSNCMVKMKPKVKLHES